MFNERYTVSTFSAFQKTAEVGTSRPSRPISLYADNARATSRSRRRRAVGPRARWVVKAWQVAVDTRPGRHAIVRVLVDSSCVTVR